MEQSEPPVPVCPAPTGTAWVRRQPVPDLPATTWCLAAALLRACPGFDAVDGTPEVNPSSLPG